MGREQPSAGPISHLSPRPVPHAPLLGFSTSPGFLGPIHLATPNTLANTTLPSAIPRPSLTITCKAHGHQSAATARYGVDFIFAAQVTGDVDFLAANSLPLTGVFI